MGQVAGQVSGNLRGDFPWPGLPCRPSDELEMMDFLSMESEATQDYTNTLKSIQIITFVWGSLYKSLIIPVDRRRLGELFKGLKSRDPTERRQ